MEITYHRRIYATGVKNNIDTGQFSKLEGVIMTDPRHFGLPSSLANAKKDLSSWMAAIGCLNALRSLQCLS